MKRLENTTLFHHFEHTIASVLFEETTYPWEVLPRISDFILEIGILLPKEEYDEVDKNVWIAKSAKIYPNTYIGGPAIIGPETEVRPGAFIRGNAIVGANAVVGNSTELKNVILFDGVQVPHYNYVGDAILGYKAHMGAGSITSNIKADKKDIVIKLDDIRYETKMRKIGAILGDYTDIGCNTVLNPGTVVGRHTNIYPVSCVRGCVPAHSIYKDKDHIVKKEEE